MNQTQQKPEAQAAPEQRSRGNSHDAENPAPAAERLASRAHEAIDRAEETASSIEDGLRSRARHAAEVAAEAEERALAGARDHAAQARRYIRSNPFATAGIAFAAGIVISALLRR